MDRYPGRTIVLVLLTLGALGFWFQRLLVESEEVPPRESSSAGIQEQRPSEPPPPPATAWETARSSTDPMTGESAWFAQVSDLVRPTRRMGFPYEDASALIRFQCLAGGEDMIYLLFPDGAPNLTDTDTESGYDVIESRVRWDDEIRTEIWTQEWGSEVLHARNDRAIEGRLRRHHRMLIELNWYGEGAVHFPVSLDGASAAIDEARQRCQA